MHESAKDMQRLGRLLCTLLICLSLITPTRADDSVSPSLGKVAFLIGTSNNGIFDDKTLRFVADQAGIVVIDSPLVGPSPAHHYPALVERFHAIQPGLPILLYTWASRWHNTNRIGTFTLQGYANLGKLLLRDAKGNVLQRRGGKLLFGDVREKHYRDWLVRQVQKMIAKTGVDGVALDVAIRTPAQMLAGLCKSDSTFCANYALGMDGLFSGLRADLQPKLVIYNGLWSLYGGQLEDQEKLLSYTDGVVIEYFGMHPKHEVPPFDEGILPYLEIMRKNPEKLFLVFGRGPWGYTDYEEDYLWQRYLYCAYLLAAGPNTLFKYHASFQVPPHAGRSGGLDTYADWGLDMGEPVGPFQCHDGLYRRHFTKGEVLVVPHDGQQKRYVLKKPIFTPEGEQIQRSIDIEPGTGLLLFEVLPHRKQKRIWDNWQNNMASWRWAKTCSDENGYRFVKLETLGKGQQGEHDLMLDSIRFLQGRSRLHVRVRTKDKRAKLLAVAEVDDERRQRMRVLVTLMSDATPAKETIVSMAPWMIFRSSSSNARGKIPVVKARDFLPTNGQWHDIMIDGAQLFDSTHRYRFKRWCWFRPLGPLGLGDLRLEPRSQQ